MTFMDIFDKGRRDKIRDALQRGDAQSVLRRKPAPDSIADGRADTVLQPWSGQPITSKVLHPQERFSADEFTITFIGREGNVAKYLIDNNGDAGVERLGIGHGYVYNVRYKQGPAYLEVIAREDPDAANSAVLEIAVKPVQGRSQ